MVLNKNETQSSVEITEMTSLKFDNLLLENSEEEVA